MMGRIIFWNPIRGFGFILQADGSQIFFHKNHCDKEPILSATVSYELSPPFREGRPPQATNVKVGVVAGGE